MGQHYVSIHQYDLALNFLNTGLEKLHNANGDYLFWEADANYNLAMANASTNHPEKAAEFYEKAETLYDEAYGGQYDNVYMDFMRNAASFYATQNN
ncbi:MAG: tetratricopeptide repeat protein, partial [Alphaproteobacteria bacterium]